MSASNFFAGALCGLAVGLLIAPEKGSDLRNDIADNAEKFKLKFNRLVGRTDAKLNELRAILDRNIEGLSEDVRHRILTMLDDATEMAYDSNSSSNNH